MCFRLVVALWISLEIHLCHISYRSDTCYNLISQSFRREFRFQTLLSTHWITNDLNSELWLIFATHRLTCGDNTLLIIAHLDRLPITLYTIGYIFVCYYVNYTYYAYYPYHQYYIPEGIYDSYTLVLQQQSTMKVWLDEVNGSNAERNVVGGSLP